MWGIYNEAHSEFGGPIGRIESDGRICNHSTFSYGYLVGRVDNEGRVYSYPQHVQYPLEEYRYEVGRVKDNIIYERYMYSILEDSWSPFAHVGTNAIPEVHLSEPDNAPLTASAPEAAAQKRQVSDSGTGDTATLAQSLAMAVENGFFSQGGEEDIAKYRTDVSSPVSGQAGAGASATVRKVPPFQSAQEYDDGPQGNQHKPVQPYREADESQPIYKKPLFFVGCAVAVILILIIMYNME